MEINFEALAEIMLRFRIFAIRELLN